MQHVVLVNLNVVHVVIGISVSVYRYFSNAFMMQGISMQASDIHGCKNGRQREVAGFCGGSLLCLVEN